MASNTSNPYEESARLRKAFRLMTVCLSAGMSAAEVRMSTARERSLIARIAGVKSASQATWRIAASSIEDYYAAMTLFHAAVKRKAKKR